MDTNLKNERVNDENVDWDGLDDPDGDDSQHEFKYCDDTQLNLLGAILTEPELLAFAVSAGLTAKAFSVPCGLQIADIAIKYWQAYQCPPTKELIRRELQDKLADNKRLPLYLMQLDVAVGSFHPNLDSKEYVKDKLAAFAKNQATLKAYHDFIKSLNGKHDYDSAHKVFCEEIDRINALQKENEFRLWDMVEIDDGEAITWQVADHFPINSTTTVFGESGALKSFWCLDLSLSVAFGVDFLERFAVKQGNVLYLFSEGGYGLKGRVRAWREAHGLTTTPSIVFSKVSHDLQNKAEVDRLIMEAKGRLPDGRIDLIVIDTLSRNFGAGDTDKNVDMKNYLRSVDKIRETTQATVIHIHHTGWGDAERERGAKCLRDFSDTSIIVKKTDDHVEIGCKKQKDAPNFEPYILERVQTGDSLSLKWIGHKADIKRAKERDDKADGLAVIMDHIPNLTIETEPTITNTVTACQIETATGLTGSQVQKRLAQLVSDGKILKQKLQPKTKTAYYWQSTYLVP